MRTGLAWAATKAEALEDALARLDDDNSKTVLRADLQRARAWKKALLRVTCLRPLRPARSTA